MHDFKCILTKIIRQKEVINSYWTLPRERNLRIDKRVYDLFYRAEKQRHYVAAVIVN